MSNYKKVLKNIWHFIWEDDSIWSWIVNVALAFILIKFIVYPSLGFMLKTTHPVVAVVSESMEHDGSFNTWWENANPWYLNNGITKEQFIKFPMKNGFNKGDIMVLKGKKIEEVKVGDIIVFWSAKRDPIIHRVVKKWEESNKFYFQTKGDNYRTNPSSIHSTQIEEGKVVVTLDETKISQEQYVGNAIIKIPFLGYIKIWFVSLLNYIKIGYIKLFNLG